MTVLCKFSVVLIEESVENFSYQLFAENMEDTNPVLSPVSAYLALTMAGEGTDGNTKKLID